MTEGIGKKINQQYYENRVKKGCPYGEEYFCSGKVNRTVKRKGEKRKDIEPCEFFIKGKCRNAEVRI